MADIKIAYASQAALTITLASLAASAGLVAGQESDAVDNTTNKYLDYLLSGKVTTGTGPTAGTIEVWVVPQYEETPTYPDVFDGTNSAETVTSADIKNAALAYAGAVATDTTANRTYWFKPVSVASPFGGVCPPKFSIFVVHSTVAALHATGSNHAFWVKPAYMTSGV